MASSSTELQWRCQAMSHRQVLRFVMPGQQVLRTTNLPKTSNCVGWWYLAALVLRCTGGDRDVLSSSRAGRW